MKNKKLAIVALHPIIYQTQIFSSLQKFIDKKNINLNLKVFFQSDISLRNNFFKEINTSFKPDTPNLLKGYKYNFLYKYSHTKNYIHKIFYNLTKHIIAINKISSFKPDVILIHGYQGISSLLLFIYAKVFNIRVIWRGEVTMKNSSSLIVGLLKRFFLITYFKNCDAILYSCSKNKKYLLHHNTQESKLFFAPSAVDNSFFKKNFHTLRDKKSYYRKLYNISKSDFVVLFCCRFTLRKNPYDLIYAVSKMNKKDNTIILFVGDGPEREKMENLCAILNLRSLFVGFKNQSEISIFYTIADILAITSFYDPSPKVINEAMNFFLPIIASSSIGTVPDLVIHNKNGFIFDIGDIKKITEFLEILSSNLDIRKKFGKQSGAFVSSWTHADNAIAILNALTFLKINFKK